MHSSDDTIVAIATPIGEGGISVVRVSGRDALAIADRCFRGRSPLTSAQSHTAHFGAIVDSDGSVVDEAVVTVFLAPHSYTAEDVIEVSCHGGMYVTRRILEIFLQLGCRPAEPGEFTKRAFLNGRIDLSQAEAVADLIKSRSELSHRTSVMQLQGRVSEKIRMLRDKLINLCSLIELELDFAEEGIELAGSEKMKHVMEETIDFIKTMIDSYAVGRLVRDGVRVVLTGKPNVGKSSILNSLLNQNRAIVTDIPGTTRDTIEESISIDGILFMLVDTAGLHDSPDLIETEGIVRAQKQIENADITLFVIAANEGFLPEDEAVFDQQIYSHILDNSSCILIVNKIDLCEDYRNLPTPPKLSHLPRVHVSAKSGEGFNDLREILSESAMKDSMTAADRSLVITNVRHRECLKKAMDNLAQALTSVRDRRSNEFVAVDLRQAINSLGEIIGEVATDDILNNIFSRFCIGK